MISNEKQKEVKSLIHEAFERFARRLLAIEHYFGVQVDGKWTRTITINNKKITIETRIEKC